MKIPDTTSTASQKLGIPHSTLLSLEKRGVVGPFARDAANRRLISEEDIDTVRQYLDSRGRRRVPS